MDEIYFLARYAPFWAVPLLLIAGEFAYVAWIRKKKKWVFFCVTLCVIGAASLVFYYWAGGPEKTVQYIMKLHHFYTR